MAGYYAGNRIAAMRSESHYSASSDHCTRADFAIRTRSLSSSILQCLWWLTATALWYLDMDSTCVLVISFIASGRFIRFYGANEKRQRRVHNFRKWLGRSSEYVDDTDPLRSAYIYGEAIEPKSEGGGHTYKCYRRRDVRSIIVFNPPLRRLLV